MKTILIVEDDHRLNTVLESYLSETYSVITVRSGVEGLRCFQQNAVDLILLDVRLPGFDGGKLLEMVRDESSIPIIVLSEISETSVTMSMLMNGANDYVVKPVDANILKARVAEQLSIEHKFVSPKGVRYKNIKYYPADLKIELSGELVDLSKKEVEIMKLLLNNPNKTITKESLYASIWGEGLSLDENTVNVHISSIRKKFRRIDPSIEYIQTVWVWVFVYRKSNGPLKETSKVFL